MSQADVHTALAAYLQPRLDQYLDLLRRMVSINSFTANPAGVNALGELTAAAFTPLGFTPQFVPAAHPAYGRHVVLTRPGRTGRTIGLVSHLDTVFPPEEEQQHSFGWRVEGDRLYGPGTVDIKGGTVVMLLVLEALRAVAPDAFADVTWVVLLNAAEEVLAPDFGDLCLRALGREALACLVFEGGRLGGECSLVAARKGRAVYHVQAVGRSAHAGNHHVRGANAVVAMAQTVQRIAKLTDYERHLTFNVGRVQGGTVANRVPHFAEAQIEMRAFAPDVFADGVRGMLALGGPSEVGSADGDFRCHVQIDVVTQTAPWPRNEGTDWLLEFWRVAAAALGLRVVTEERGGLSDGNWTWQHVPTLDGLGPSGGNMHCSERSADGSKDQEFVLASSFVPKATLNAVALLRLLEAV